MLIDRQSSQIHGTCGHSIQWTILVDASIFLNDVLFGELVLLKNQ